MKRCPECRRDYYDDTLLYCLDDGSRLLDGPSSDEPGTAILSDPGAIQSGYPSGEAATAVFQSSSASQIDTSNSIAVLPFVNMSADADNEYFCDGLAEELLNALSKIEGLKVAARTSAFSFKGKNTDISEIGRKLSVKTALEGSVRKSGNKLRISVQLVNASDGYHLWSERYDSEMQDIFDVQDEIALAVVAALKLKLFGDARSAILKKGTDNAEAYELYLRGRSLWNKRTFADFTKAIEYFEQAIALDPKYALAYSGLADCHSFLGYFEAFAPDEVAPKAKAAVLKALELDDTLAEVQASLAMYKEFYEFDRDACENGLRRAIELNPNFSTAHYWLCSVLAAQKHFEESRKEGQIALDLDPLSPIVNGNVARGLCHARQYDEAIKLALKSLEITPDFFFTHWVLGVAYSQTGRLDEAIDNFRKSVSNSGISALKADLGVALAMAGQTGEALEIIDEFKEQAKLGYVSPLCISKIYLGLGETAKGLKWLEKACEKRAIGLLWLATEPVFDPVRSEPVFKDVLRRLNFPESIFV